MKYNSKKRGFSIIELVIVIAVIAVFTAILIPTLGDVIVKVKDSKATQDAKNAYTQFVIDNVKEGELSRFYIFKADNKRYVTLIDGAAKEIYSTRKKALNSFSDQFVDGEGEPIPYDLVSTMNSKLWAVAEVKGNEVKEKPKLADITLEYGNKFQNDPSHVYASSSLNFYMRAGEVVMLPEDKDGYRIAIIRMPEVGTMGTMSKWYPDANQGAPRDLFIANEEGWYGFVLKKEEGEFDFSSDSNKLGDYVSVDVPVRIDHPLMNSIHLELMTTQVNLFLYEGETVTVLDGYVASFIESPDMFTPQSGAVFRKSYTPDNDGWYFIIIMKEDRTKFSGSDSRKLYDYITVERNEDAG